MKTLKMSPVVRILIQMAVGTASGILAAVLTVLILPVFLYPLSYVFPDLFDFSFIPFIIAIFYLGSLFAIKTINTISGRKQKYTFTLMTIPVFTIATITTIFLWDSMEEEYWPPFFVYVLILVGLTTLLILVTHLEVFLRKHYKLSRR